MAASMEPVLAVICVALAEVWAVAAATAAVVLTAVVEFAGLTQVCESEHDRSMGELRGSVVDDDEDRLLLLDFS